MRSHHQHLILSLIFGFLLQLLPTGATAADPRGRDFNSGWRFLLADSVSAAAPDFDDSSWRILNLPHDWAIEGDFSIDHPSGTAGGALPGGVGWYRKRFNAPDAEGKNIFIDFDGAYMNSTVYINGHKLGTRPYGYASFSYDLTPWLHPDGENVIAVRVDNAEQPNSRWYSGCGIYRNVTLRTLNDIFIPLWGQHVTSSVTDSIATLTIRSEIMSKADDVTKINLTCNLFDPDGKKIAASAPQCLYIPTNSSDTIVCTGISVKSPRLWSTHAPNLYTLETVITDANSSDTLDVYTLRTGFRYFRFDPRTGFTLNGVPMKINGVCMHHDLGALGAAVNTRAIERQLEILKDMGVNAIRCSHNPPAPELLDLCDRMGMLVMDESFDMWRKKKTAHDYSRYFTDWHERDLEMLMKRDRNHPSIILWSIGNEVLEQWTNARADTLSIDQANYLLNFGHPDDIQAAKEAGLSVNSMLAKKLADLVRHYQPDALVTAGCNEPKPSNHLFRSGALDVIGFNYHNNQFDSVPVWYKEKPFIISESVSGLMTRGYYRMPSDSIFIWPKRWDSGFSDPSMACSSYDNCHVPWGNNHEETLYMVETRPFISGQFIWTGFDYIGEPTPYGWPARSSYFGIVDLAGIPKDIYYMYQSQWRPDKTVLHLFPHWNHNPGEMVDLWAYFNNADEVELLVNGVSKGSKSKPAASYHVSWRVPFEPGRVEAISRKDGQIVARRIVETAGEPARLRLTPDRTVIKADGNDLSYILVEVRDSEGRLCPDAENLIHFKVEGAGRNEGVDNGSPISLERFKSDSRKAFHGKAMLIVRNDGSPGPISVSASSPQLTSTSVTIDAHN